MYTKRKELKEELKHVEKELFNHSKENKHYQSFLTSMVLLTLLHIQFKYNRCSEETINLHLIVDDYLNRKTSPLFYETSVEDKHLVVSKVMYNFVEALRKTFFTKEEEFLFDSPIEKNRTREIFEELCLIGKTKNTLTYQFFLFSLKQMKEKDISPKDIDYSNFVDKQKTSFFKNLKEKMKDLFKNKNKVPMILYSVE